MCLLFLVRFCYAKPVACGRVMERERGNPQRFPPHTPLSLRYAGVRAVKAVDDHQRKTRVSVSFFGVQSLSHYILYLSKAGRRSVPRRRRSYASAGMGLLK